MRELPSAHKRPRQTAAERLLSLLEASGGDYCILHGWRDLGGPIVSDLDVAISPRDLGKLKGTICRTEGMRIVQMIEHETTCNYFVLALGNSASAGFVALDTAVDYRRDGRVFFALEEMLAGRRSWNGFRVAAPEVEFKYLLVKKVLKGGFPRHQRERLQELACELGAGGEGISTRLFGNGWGARLLHWAKSGNWEMVERHSVELRRVLRWQQLQSDPLNPARYWLPEISRLLARLRQPTGLFAAILGPDGAGKSTLIECLRGNLAGAFRRTAVFHLMPGLLRRKGTGAPVIDPHGKLPRSQIVSLLKLLYYWLDCVLGYWLIVRPALVRSTLTLFDRYIDDVLVDPLRYRFPKQPGLDRWLPRLTPRPEILILLDLPVEVAHSRKREISVEEARTLRDRYLQLARSSRNAHIVDASRPLQEVAADVERLLLDYMEVRVHRRLGLVR